MAWLWPGCGLAVAWLWAICSGGLVDWEHCLRGNPLGTQDQRSGVKIFHGADGAQRGTIEGNRSRRISQPIINKGFALKTSANPSNRKSIIRMNDQLAGAGAGAGAAGAAGASAGGAGALTGAAAGATGVGE